MSKRLPKKKTENLKKTKRKVNFDSTTNVLLTEQTHNEIDSALSKISQGDNIEHNVKSQSNETQMGGSLPNGEFQQRIEEFQKKIDEYQQKLEEKDKEIETLKTKLNEQELVVDDLTNKYMIEVEKHCETKSRTKEFILLADNHIKLYRKQLEKFI